MNGVQKVIKYCAMAFAVFLSVVIFGAIATAVVGVATGVAGVSMFAEEKERVDLSREYSLEDIERLGIGDILIDCNAEIIVKRGEVLSIEASNVTEDYEIRCADGELSIVEERPNFYFNWIFWGKDATVRERVEVTIPAEFEAEQVTIYSGSGEVSVTGAEADRLMIDSGSGRLTVQAVKVAKLTVDSGSGRVSLTDVTAGETVLNTGSGRVSADDSVLGILELDSGSGSVNLENVAVSDVILDSGSGSVAIKGDITGNCMFDTGSGSISVAVNGAEEDYRVVVDSGRGTFRINGRKTEDGSYGKNVRGELGFDSGSGSVSIMFNTPQEESTTDR